MFTVNYWSAWRLQQGVFGQLSHFALDNRCNFSGLWGAWNGFTSRCQSSLHPEYSIFQGIIQNPWDRSLPGGIWAYLNIVCQIFFWVLRRHLYLSRHAWWFESWRCPKGHSPHLRSRTNPPFGSFGRFLSVLCFRASNRLILSKKKKDYSVRLCGSIGDFCTTSLSLSRFLCCGTLVLSAHVHKILKSGHGFNPRITGHSGLIQSLCSTNVCVSVSQPW